MKKVILILITTVVLPYVVLAQAVPTSYPGSGITYYGLNSDTTVSGSSHFGSDAGYNALANWGTDFFGNYAGASSDGNGLVYIGGYSGQNAIGSYNVAVGNGAGYNSSGSNNVYLGDSAGTYVASGSNNVFLGTKSGFSCDGDNNVFLGKSSGDSSNGSNNVFIGSNVGINLNVSNKLYIDNSNTTTPLVYGKFDTDQVGINTNYIPSDYTFAVNGKMIAKEILVQVDPWPDFVFNKEYNLPSLKEVEHHIKENGHLQNIPSASEVEEHGILLGDMNAKLLQKIEELTLYTIQQQKELEAQKNENSSLEDRLLKKVEAQEKINKELKDRLLKLEDLIKS